METDEQGWNRSADERDALVAKARTWEGTQREFAAAHGVNQSTVSKWQRTAGPRSYTAEERARVVEAFASFEGTQREHDDAQGLPRGTTGKWVCQSRMGTRGRRPPLVLKSPPPRPAPTFLEVVPVVPAAPVARRLAAAANPFPPVGASLSLPGGAELRFDALPSARWVAELVAELARC